MKTGKNWQQNLNQQTNDRQVNLIEDNKELPGIN